MHPYKDLQMAGGMVKENYVVIKRRQRKLWLHREFKPIWYYPIFLRIPKLSEIVMLGKPQTISEYTIEKLIGASILDFSTCLGDYGMGGPGFFGIRVQNVEGIFWLTYCIWAADEHILLDNRVMSTHSNVSKYFQPWLKTEGDWDTIEAMLKDTLIEDVDLQEHSLKITLRKKDGEMHTLNTQRESNAFPPQGGTGKRRRSYETGIMSDYWLVTYDETVLRV